MPPDYVALLQHVMEPVVPHPTPADHSRFLSYTTKRGMTRDKTASAACTCLLASAFLYNVAILWRLLYPKTPNDYPPGWPVSNVIATATTSVCWVLAHVLMELAFMCWVSREPALYRRHHSGCIMVTRTGLLVLMSFYIPKTYDHTLAIEVHTGRAAAATLRLVTGFVAVHVLEVLCFRLPIKLALPYHSARVAFSLAILPTTTIRAFARNPAVTAVACELWEQIGQLFLGAASWVLGAPLDPLDSILNSNLGGTVMSALTADSAASHLAQSAAQLAQDAADGSQGLCTAALLLVFLNISLGLLVPLYVLYVWELSDFRAFLLAGDRNSSSSSSHTNSASSSHSLGSILALSSSSVTSGILDQQQQQQHLEGQQPDAAAAQGSNEEHAAAAAEAAPCPIARTRPAVGGSSGSSSSSLPGSSLLQAALAARAGAAQAAAAAAAAAGPADAAAAADVPATSMADPSAEPTLGSSGDECGALATVWPIHFSVPLHALVLFCLTGVVWAVLNAAWGIWQRKFGEGACFVSWLV